MDSYARQTGDKTQHMITQYDFFRTKYGEELLIDLISLEDIEKYIRLSPVQRLTYYDITFIAEGQGTFSIDNYEQTIEQGIVFFSSPGQVRKWNTDTIPKGYVVIFEDEFLCTFFNDTLFVKNLSYFHLYDNPPFLRLAASDYHHVVELLQNIRNEISSVKGNDRHLLRALLYQVLVLLNRRFVTAYPLSRKKQANRYVNIYIQLVEANHDQHRSVEYYAQQLHITSGHLNSLVKDHFGISAKKYILNRSMLEAKRMLQYTNMGVDEIAYRLNYENTTYFIRIFREHSDMTPLQFRMQMNP